MDQNFNVNKLARSVAAACAIAGMPAAQAGIGFKAGAWDLDFSGNVNGFATFNNCDDKSQFIAGGLACNTGPGGNDQQSIESGLLPSALVFSAKTRQANLDIGVTVGLYPTIRTNSGVSGNAGLGSSSINVRQNFLTFGDKGWGTIKVGRDIGLYAADAILSDMTLLGVGSGAAFLGGSTTLGRIGAGYIYTDWIPQITYSSPTFGGFQFAVGVFQGLDVLPPVVNGFADASLAVMSDHDSPGAQGKVSYEWKGNVGGKAWASAMYQKVKSKPGELAPGVGSRSIDGTGWDVGAKINFAGLEAVGYYYDAQGIGTTAIGFGAASFNPVTLTLEERDSSGYYGQVTYKIGPVKLGYSYGVSELDLAGNESAASNPNLVDKNKSHVVGVYYGLTPALSLVAEYIRTETEPQSGPEQKDDAFALGAILFF